MHSTDPGPTPAQQRQLRELALEAGRSFVPPITRSDADEQLGILRHAIATTNIEWDRVVPDRLEEDAVVRGLDPLYQPVPNRRR